MTTQKTYELRCRSISQRIRRTNEYIDKLLRRIAKLEKENEKLKEDRVSYADKP